MDDRRSYERFPVQLDVKLRKCEGTSAEMDGTIFDVSFRGLGITVSEELQLQPGTEVSVEWPSPPFYFDGDAVVRCTVVSIQRDKGECGPVRLGVQFSDPDSELAQRLINWVQMEASMQKRSQSVANRFSSKQKRIKF
jgi:hypothetical protein